MKTREQAANAFLAKISNTQTIKIPIEEDTIDFIKIPENEPLNLQVIDSFDNNTPLKSPIQIEMDQEEENNEVLLFTYPGVFRFNKGPVSVFSISATNLSRKKATATKRKTPLFYLLT